MTWRRIGAWAYLVAALGVCLYILVDLVMLMARAVHRRDWLFIGVYVGGFAIYGLALWLIKLYFKYAPSALSGITELKLNAASDSKNPS